MSPAGRARLSPISFAQLPYASSVAAVASAGVRVVSQILSTVRPGLLSSSSSRATVFSSTEGDEGGEPSRANAGEISRRSLWWALP